jgi:hypothetical protein
MPILWLHVYVATAHVKGHFSITNATGETPFPYFATVRYLLIDCIDPFPHSLCPTFLNRVTAFDSSLSYCTEKALSTSVTAAVARQVA